MTWAPALAGLAGLLVPVAVAELVAVRPRRSPRAAADGRRALLVPLLAGLGRRLGVPDAPGDLARRLAASGVRSGIRPADVMAVKGGAGLAAGLAALGPAAALPGRLGPVALVVAPAAGFFAPDLWLRRLARRRGTRMACELADVLDLLRVAVEAGLPPARAMAEVGGRHHGLLGRELRGSAAQLALGVPQAAVLLALRDRCPLPGMVALVAALERAGRHGAPLAPALAALAGDARAQRARDLRDEAARAAPKIQLVIALLLVPAVMLLVAAAVLSGLAT